MKWIIYGCSSYICKKYKCKQTEPLNASNCFRWFPYNNSHQSFTKKIWNHKINEVLNHIQCETAGLTQVQEIMAEARGMLTVDIDLKDRLVVNGQLGTAKYISQGSINSVIKIYFTLSWTEKDEHW